MSGETEKDFNDQHMEEIRKAIGEIQYGSVSIIIQDGKIVQIDKTEKRRVFK